MSPKLEYLWFFFFMKQVVAMTQNMLDILLYPESPVELVVVGDTYLAITAQCHMGCRRMSGPWGLERLAWFCSGFRSGKVSWKKHGCGFGGHTRVCQMGRWRHSRNGPQACAHYGTRSWHFWVASSRCLLNVQSWELEGKAAGQTQRSLHVLLGPWNLSQGLWESWKSWDRRIAGSYLYFSVKQYDCHLRRDPQTGVLGRNSAHCLLLLKTFYWSTVLYLCTVHACFCAAMPSCWDWEAGTVHCLVLHRTSFLTLAVRDGISARDHREPMVKVRAQVKAKEEGRNPTSTRVSSERT